MAVAAAFAGAVFLTCQGVWMLALALPLPVLLKRRTGGAAAPWCAWEWRRG